MISIFYQIQVELSTFSAASCGMGFFPFVAVKGIFAGFQGGVLFRYISLGIINPGLDIVSGQLQAVNVKIPDAVFEPEGQHGILPFCRR